MGSISDIFGGIGVVGRHLPFFQPGMGISTKGSVSVKARIECVPASHH